jgi:basic membrane lipoprotein Med (substrate-binding protein (PBP1-ABC) superfamily)
MKKKLLAIMIVLLAFAVLMPLAAQKAAPFKVAFIYIGPPGDLGWTYEHDAPARQLPPSSATRSSSTTSRTSPRAPMRSASSASTPRTATT